MYEFVHSEELNGSADEDGPLSANILSSDGAGNSSAGSHSSQLVSNDTSFSDFYNYRHIDENDKGMARIIDLEI